MDINDVIAALSALRISPAVSEMELHARVAEGLAQAGITIAHEARLAPRCRIDFLTDSGIGIEIKCGKPPRRGLLNQLARYAACSQVHGLILVVERSANLPPSVCGKPCRFVSLNRLWGIALP
jgi:hypothetical protein